MRYFTLWLGQMIRAVGEFLNHSPAALFLLVGITFLKVFTEVIRASAARQCCRGAGCPRIISQTWGCLKSPIYHSVHPGLKPRAKLKTILKPVKTGWEELDVLPSPIHGA